MWPREAAIEKLVYLSEQRPGRQWTRERAAGWLDSEMRQLRRVLRRVVRFVEGDIEDPARELLDAIKRDFITGDEPGDDE